MKIVIKPDGKIRVWKKREEKWKGFCLEYLGQGASQSLKLMVWGTITFRGILAFVESNMNFQKYISVLDEHIWPVIVKEIRKKKPLAFHGRQISCSSLPRDRRLETEKQTFVWPRQSTYLNPIVNV